MARKNKRKPAHGPTVALGLAAGLLLLGKHDKMRKREARLRRAMSRKRGLGEQKTKDKASSKTEQRY